MQNMTFKSVVGFDAHESQHVAMNTGNTRNTYATLLSEKKYYQFCALLCFVAAIGLSASLAVVHLNNHSSEHWLVSTSGQCSLANITSGEITFEYSPEVYVRFTDYPFHKTKTYYDVSMMAVDLASPGWDHRNIALTVEDLIVVFEVLRHDHDDGGIAYRGRILNTDELSNIPAQGLEITSSNCSLYVDAEKQCSDQPLLLMSVKALIEQVQGDARDTTLSDPYDSCDSCSTQRCTYKTWERHGRLGGNLSWLECADTPLCFDVCAALGISLANDGVCDDGGSVRDGGIESSNAYCPLGTDCGDCGFRDSPSQSYDGYS